MRAPAPISPARTDRQRLLNSCAIAAGLAAIALGGPALAQVQGSGEVVIGTGLGTATIDNAPVGKPNTTQVVANGNQTVINWTPSGTAPAGSPIEFLATGNTLEYYGTGDYTVLNRFIARDGAGNPIPLNQQIAINGNVNSYVGPPAAGSSAPQGGNIWFYNAGGILIGSNAVLNIGSLVLTANDIDTNGGLFGPGGEIRFRGASGSTSAVEIAPRAFINASNPGNPGSSYVALVAPRIVQAGAISSDGSSALVAAEQADITINNGLFDINVTIGAEGGNAITHSGITGGPAHQQGDTDQSRVYMVAIPKNDAVTMLISGQIGYQDALSAQTDPDGAVRLSAGYNIVDGEIAAAPVNTTAANIVANDVVFASNVVAHASGDFTGGAVQQLPPPVLPSAPPPGQGLFLVQGDGTFIGDRSATVSIGTNQAGGAFGNFTLQSNGSGAAAGSATLNVDNGGTFRVGLPSSPGGNLSILAGGRPDATTGDSRGGTATLSIAGGVVQAVGVTVSADATGGLASDGSGGDGFGGTAGIAVTGIGAALTTDTIDVSASGGGGGVTVDALSNIVIADRGGNGTGGSANIVASGGGSITANASVAVNASGAGQIGNVQSGDGQGGTARIEVNDPGTSFTAPVTAITAGGLGGGSISDPSLGTFPSAAGGNGTGGTVELVLSGDQTTTVLLGDATLNAAGTGGGADGDGTAGGDAQGGNATITADGNLSASLNSLTVNASATSGGATSSTGTSSRTGDATGGDIILTANGAAALTSGGAINLDASAIAATGENRGNAQGGTVSVTAIGSGGGSSITAAGEFLINAGAGSFSTGIPSSTGSATGGDIDFTADGGTIAAGFFSVGANAASDNTTGAGGAAQGGTIDIRAANTGVITATDSVNGSRFSVNAGAGVSQGGSPATGGRIGVIIDGGTVSFAARSLFDATGITGGDQSAAGNIVSGRGGSILFQTLDNNLNTSTFNFTAIDANADGRAQAPFEGAAFLRGTAAGNGGDVTFNVQGGQISGGSIGLSASGYGSATGDSDGLGAGGIATYSQTGGTVSVSELVVSADGSGGGGPGGAGVGGTATITLASGTLTATDITAQAVGSGGFGDSGSDSDPANPVDGRDGGFGQGGTATITLDGDAVVTTTTLNAFASGIGGGGGDYFSGNSVAGNVGDGGNGLGGNATITLTAGSLTTTDIITDAGGVGGNGGQFFDFSSPSSTATGRGGNGGSGQGGTATIGLATAITTTGDIGSRATGRGGNGGAGHTAGEGGQARGGTAELVVTGISVATGAVVLDARADGGDGGNAMNGAGGRGGYAEGGTARVRAEGTGAYARVTDDNFITTGTGGRGGNAALFGGNGPLFGPRGGDGGDGRGGTIELVANDGTLELAIASSGLAGLASRGTGGDGGTGGGNPGSIILPGPDGIPGTPDDIVQGRIGGDGGVGGSGVGGTVRLTANGGTITSGGDSISIAANGTSGNGGNGGDGSGGTGANGGSFGTQGGTVALEARNSASNRGRISFGDTVIDASGDTAGRVELIADGSITMPSLTVTAAGFAALTNNDTDLAPAGIFMSIIDGGLIQTDGAVSLTTGSSVGVYAQGTGQLNVGGSLDVTVDDQVDIRHDFRAGTGPTIQTGGSAAFTATNSIRSAPGSLVSAGASLTMTATGLNSAIDVDSLDAANGTRLLADGGRINVYGTTTSGDDLVANARDEVAIANAVAGDDIALQGGTIVAGRLITNGTGADSELDGSNIVIGTTGAASVDHAEADNDFTATAGSFATGPNSIITGGDIDITAAGAVDLGNSSAGGFVSVSGQSIVFDTVTAGTTVGLTATGTAAGAEGILGNGIDAGDNVTLIGNSIRINDSVVTSASLFAGATGGNASLSATIDGDITVNATGDIGGTFVSQGNINLTGGGNVTAQVATSGGYVGPNGVSEGYVFVNAGGTANLLAGSGAATMVGVRAGTNATVDGTTAGEDIYVIAGNTATVTNTVAGDDVIVTGTCCVIVDTVSTTGTAPDTRGLVFGPSSAGGPDIWQIQSRSPDQSNIVLTASAGTIDVANADAFDNLTATASDVVRSTGTLRSGLVTMITGSALDLESVTAGTDILLTSTSGGITAIGALSAGHDLTIASAADGVFADLAAGDDIRIAANGNVTAASLLTTAGGLDNESDNSGAYIDTPGNIAITGTTDTVGQTRLTAGGTIDAGAITADYSFIDAVGAVNVTGDIASGGMFIEGSSVALRNANGNSGQILLAANSGGVTVDGTVTTLGGIEIDAPGAIAITGAANGDNYVQMTGGSIAVTDVSSGNHVALTSTSGAINATGTISAGSDVILDAAAGGTFNALVAADDVSISAGGDVTIASITAEGSDPQTDEVGSNVTGTVTGTLTVTGSTFARDDLTFNATGIALQDVAAGGSFTATTSGGPISLTSADVGGTIALTSARDVIATGALESGLATTISGRNLDLGSVTAGTNVTLTATNGTIASTGTIAAGRDIVVAAAQGGTFDRLVAGDDIGITGGGGVTVAFLDATGDNPDSGETGSNVTINVAGDVHVEHGEAADNFTATVAGFSTGLNSIITGGDIDIVAAGAADLGNSTAGGHIDVDAQSIAFVGLDAGGYVDLDATGSSSGAGDIAGGTILAGSDVLLAGNGIAVDTIEAAGSLSAVGTGGDVAIVQANIGGNIGASATGDLTGSYAAGGDIAFGAGGDITASANAAGGFPDPRNADIETAGNVFIDAGGNVTLTDSSASGMLGVNAGGSATLTNVTAGEDMLVLAGTTANLSEITVGDDLDVRAAGAITATGVSATGDGPDGFLLNYTSNGFTIGQGEGSSSLDGADIDLRSSGGSIAAAGLSAGDDIFLNAATTLSVSGATTLGLGQTGGDSSIRTQSGGDASFAGLNAFDDIAIGSGGAVSITARARAGRDVTIGAAAVTTAILGEPNGDLVDVIVAGRDLAVTASGEIDAGAVRAGRDLSLTAGTTLAVRRAATGAGGTLSLDGADGVTAALVAGGGATSLTSAGGAIIVDSLSSVGPVAANGASIAIAGGSGNLMFSALNADAGDAVVTTTGDLSVTAGNVAGRATLRSTNGDLAVAQLAAADVQLGADDAMTLGNVTATNGLLGDAGGILAVNGVITARDISLGSGDIAIASNARVGTAGTTRTLDLRNTNGRAQTFIGGTGTRSGYHLDAAEMTRLYGTDIGIFAPQVDNNNGGFVAAAPGGLPIGSVGSSAQPDVIIDDFTMTAGGSGSNLGANGTLTIETPGKARVIGDVLFNGMTDANGLTVRANDAIEVILGEGSIKLTGTSSSGTATPAGLLTLVSADVIVATASAIADVAAAADTDAIDDRLAQNDGITSDEGALYAGGIDVGVEGGFYVQNSGAGTRFAERRGLTFGTQGLNVNTAGADTRIVINGVHLGASGQVTGLDAIAQLSINGTAVGSAPATGGSFDPRSTMNGCLIVSSGACAFQEFETSFPVQDVIEEEDKESAGKNGEGQSLPTPLITMRDLDPLTGEPLVDDPVTGAGNDDLWTPPSE